MEYNDSDLTSQIIGAAIEVHRALGPGLLESVYEAFLQAELMKRGLRVQRQLCLPVKHGDLQIEIGYRIDLLVEDRVVVEIKAVEAISRLHEAQILTYLKLSRHGVGLLLNFNVPVLKEGIRRFVYSSPMG
jgi:GxxExxY protein